MYATDDIACSFFGEFPCKEWDEYDVKLQSFAAMNGHDTYGIGCLGCRNGLVFTFSFPIFKKRFSVRYTTFGELIDEVLESG